MRLRRNNISFFWFIVKDLLLFIIGTIIEAIIIFLVVFYSFNSDVKEHEFKNLYNEIAETNEYSNIDYKKRIGKTGNFIVYDDNDNVVFSSNYSITIAKEDLKFIPQFYANFESSEDEFTKKGKKYTRIENMNSFLFVDSKGLIILDEDNNIIFDTYGIEETKITDNQKNFLRGRYNDKLSLFYNDFSKNGKTYKTIIIANFIPGLKFFEAIEAKISNIVIIVIIIIIMNIIIYLLLTNYKVKKTMTEISTHIDRYNRERNKIEFKGPKEFALLCNSFNEMTYELEKSEEITRKYQDNKKKLLSDISHDLKTPITIIKGYSDALIDNKVKEEDKIKYLSLISSKSNELNRLISELSEYNKLDRSDFSLSLTKENINEFLKQVIIGKYDEINTLGFKLDLKISDDINYVEIDKYHFSKVIDNLISNTYKYNEKGTTIFIELETDNDHAHIYYGDNGIGIPEEVKENIFEPFVIGDNARTGSKASGLGLSIVKKIIDTHNGSIELVDNKKLKTCFRITLNKIK